MFQIIKQILTLDKYDLDKWQNAIFFKEKLREKKLCKSTWPYVKRFFHPKPNN